MTIKSALKRLKIRMRVDSQKRLTEEEAWEGIKGMWEGHDIDPVAYQRKMREESDHLEV